MANNLRTNPILLDTVDDTSYLAGPMLIRNIFWTGDTANARSVTLHNAENTIQNPSMETWFSTSAAPHLWKITGAGATIAREGTTIKYGTYSAKLTRVNADCTLEQNIIATAPAPYNDITWWYGKQVYAGAWVNGTDAERVYVDINDGVTPTESSAHAGDDAWAWTAPAIHTVAVTATELSLRLKIKTGNSAAYFDRAILFVVEPIWELVGAATPVSFNPPQPISVKGLFLGGAAGAGDMLVYV